MCVVMILICGYGTHMCSYGTDMCGYNTDVCGCNSYMCGYNTDVCGYNTDVWLFSFLLGALRNSPSGKTATKAEFADAVMKWLRNAPDRDGGRARRGYPQTVYFQKGR